MANQELPSRLFADKEEPIGDRVNPYFKLNTVRVILKALTSSDIQRIRPFFGKLLDIYSKPVFSGKLAYFLLTRQLDVGNPHEIWVVFAGKPIRFSVREFGLVTGLNCDPLPTLDNSVEESPPGVTPYWFMLFGGNENVIGETLLAKLRKHKSLTDEQRLKYACLFLVDGLIGRRSFNMKIPKKHVEMIRDLDVFLKYPWGRYSFDMTMQCIKTRSLNKLAHATVAIQGFIHALILVFVEAVPAALSAAKDGSDPESGDAEVDSVISLKLDKAWELDADEKVEVLSIIPSEEYDTVIGDCSWVDEGSDRKVEEMMKLIHQRVKFRREMFVGGFRGLGAKADSPARETRKEKRKPKVKLRTRKILDGEPSKPKKLKVRPSNEAPPDPNAKLLSAISSEIQAGMKEAHSIVYAQVDVDVKAMKSRMEQSIKANIDSSISDYFRTRELVGKVLEDVGDEFGQSARNIPDVNVNPFFAPSKLSFVLPSAAHHEEGEEYANESAKESPSTSLPNELDADVCPIVVPGSETLVDSVPRLEVRSDQFTKLCLKLKPTMEVDFSNGLLLKGSHLLNLPIIIPPDYPQVMDSCVSVIRESIFDNVDPQSDPKPDMLLCKFNGSLAALYSSFKRCKKRKLLSLMQISWHL